ncbi:MAG: type II toxin-antitoxin system RelB/DinJ family antitoxin [Defluviitaleaceae bacterium]|nr:type II toxin-antitoxin system RelB/DinJ family antitoxin [Defluviitaleaceae bacterium]
MAQSILSVRVEDETKHRFDSFCENVGLNPSVAVNMFIKATLRERKIPFEITSGYDPFHSKVNKKRLLRAVKDAEQGKNMITKSFEELEAMEDD